MKQGQSRIEEKERWRKKRKCNEGMMQLMRMGRTENVMQVRNREKDAQMDEKKCHGEKEGGSEKEQRTGSSWLCII